MNGFIVKGDICYSKNKDEVFVLENGYVIYENGKCLGVYENLPRQYENFIFYNYENKIIVPGFVDLHVHAPQYAFRGLGMDLELIDWLNKHTFVEEAKYLNLDYANRAYEIFVSDLLKSATTRACIFGTIHVEATLLLMEKLEKIGLNSYVGKVNMDRNSPDNLREESPDKSFEETKRWIIESEKFKNVKPILTPRFTPSCSDELFEKLSLLQKKYNLPMQSHLSENQKEVNWVKELCENVKFYGESYNKYEMFGNSCRTIMAHCVYSGEDEVEMMKNNGVFVAHCPESNMNLSSGVAPIKKYLNKGLRVGIGTDVAAGSSLSIFKAMALAIQSSKLRWRLYDQSVSSLTFEEVFYMATKGGGEFFGNVGSFEEGYDFDLVVIDDSSIRHPEKLNLKQRVERLLYLAQDENVIAKFVNGKKIFGK